MSPFGMQWTALNREFPVFPTTCGWGHRPTQSGLREGMPLLQTFFAPAVALERLAELSFALDHAGSHQGSFQDQTSTDASITGSWI